MEELFRQLPHHKFLVLGKLDDWDYESTRYVIKSNPNAIYNETINLSQLDTMDGIINLEDELTWVVMQKIE